MFLIELHKRLCRFYLLLLIGFFISNPSPLFSQIYGLGFSSHNVSKDLRTMLDLSPGQFYSFEDEFELSFNFNLRSNEGNLFGYVCRIISKNNATIDLIFNYNDINSNYFTITSGQKLIIRLSTNFNQLSNEWAEYRLKFDLKNGEVSFITPDTVLIGTGIGFNKEEEIKILFGASDFGQFKTTDVPPMNISDIKLWQNGHLKHHWPLDELEGNSAADVVGRKKAMIRNPHWIKLNHYNWENIYQTELEGVSQVAFDPENENIILFGDNKIIRFAIASKQALEFTPKNKNINLLAGRQAFYDAKSHLLYSYDVDYPSVSVLSFDSLYWAQKKIPRNDELTVFLHHNKFYSAADSLLYIFGGYGQHEYKNKVQFFDLRTKELSTIKTSGDQFNPRYLGALGELNDTVYILGGYGSASGEQIFSPHNYYDLLAFSLKDHKFIKRFEYKSTPEDCVFANSMIIDPKDKTFYVLAFPFFKYDGYLQLIKGSLTRPDYSMMGNQIPYLFLDIKSYADLFYCKQNKKFIAVTILSDNGKSKINLYSLLFPPYQQIAQSTINRVSDSHLFLFLIPLLIIIGAMLLYYYRIKTKKKIRVREDEKIKESHVETEVLVEPAVLKPGSVLFFGGFQVIDKTGKDITRKFSPLLKELFLLLWLNSVKNDIGVSAEKLIEILWFDLPETRARNNKAVNIAKLRTILDEIGNCELSHKTGYWKIEVNNNKLWNDYLEFLKLINSRKEFTKQEILTLVKIVHRGAFLQTLTYDWLDEFKSDISNHIIDKILNFATRLNIKREPDLIITLSDSIINFDSVNEEAMLMKCKALVLLGRHSIASDTYNKFAKEYKILYNMDFEKSFTDILKQ